MKCKDANSIVNLECRDANSIGYSIFNTFYIMALAKINIFKYIFIVKSIADIPFVPSIDLLPLFLCLPLRPTTLLPVSMGYA